MEHVQTKSEIESLLSSAGIRPRKRFGQHFLIDGNLMRRLVDSAEIGPADTVLEVGPGTGGLTDLLVNRAGQVICVEIDRDLFSLLKDRFQHRPNINLICADALAGKHELCAPLIEAVQRRQPDGNRTMLVANLPYDIATPLLVNLLLEFPMMSRFCFTVQAEVGQRIAADPGSKAYGPLSIIVQTLAKVAQTARISPESFWPRPAVDSVMLRIDRVAPPPLSSDDARAFGKFVHGVFEHRRKTLRAALAYVVDDASRNRLCTLIDGTLRPEQIAIHQWQTLFAATT